MKKPETVLREYVTRSSDETLKFLGGRLSQRLAGDYGEALNTLAEVNDMDGMLKSAKSAWDLFDFVDKIQEVVEKELRKRNQDDTRETVAVETDADGQPKVRRKRYVSARD